MYRSLLLFGALLLSFAQNAFAQCSVTVNPNSVNTCVGQPFTVTASSGANSYIWYDQMMNIVGTTSVLTATPTVPGVVQYTVEADFGTCTATATVQVSANSVAAPTATNNYPCAGSTLHLWASNIPGATYIWTGPNGYASTMQNPMIPNVMMVNAGTYSVVAVVNGCQSAPASTVVTIGPGFPVTAGNSGAVCFGDNVELTVNSTTGATYSWSGPGNFSSTQQNPIFPVNNTVQGGVYTVTVTANGCMISDYTTVDICNTVYLNIYNDANNNCTYDVGTDFNPFLPSLVEIDSNGIHVDTISVTSGLYYTVNGGTGDVYTFHILSLPGSMVTTCPVNGSVDYTLQPNALNIIDMGISCGTSTDFDLFVHASNPTSSAILQTGHIYFGNLYCIPTDGTITLQHSPKYQYGASNPPATSVNGTTITWDVASISASSPNVNNIYYQLAYTTAPLIAGDTTHSYFSISPTTGDLDPTNNTFIKIDTVIASFDPNAITAFPAECVTAGTNMQYMIQFENLGNAPAENIYVLDTLPAELEVNTMELVMSSHDMITSVIHEGGYNILRFDFPNIMLPDSSDHAGRHGMLVYTIDLNSGLPYGAEIFHRAGIYFDYNDVVMTNNERTSICIPQNVSTASKNGTTMLYPNPAGDILTLQTDGSYSSCTISNSIGQTVAQQPVSSKQTTIDIHSLAAGIYYMNILGAQKNEVLKFVKK